MTNLYRGIARKAMPFLAAATMYLPVACSTDNSKSLLEPQAQEEYSPQEQETAKQAEIWYEDASADGIITSEESQRLESIVNTPVETNKKQKDIQLSQLAAINPNADLNYDTKVDIFDLLEWLKIFKDKNNYPLLAGDINSDNKTDIFDLLALLGEMKKAQTENTYLIRGTHFDNDTEQGDKALITINGKEYYTDVQGSFSARVPKADQYTITARQLNEQGEFEGFKRTKTIPGMDIDTLKVYSVDYPTQEGVTPELFKRFCEIACFEPASNGFDYWGMKTGLKNKDNVFWIATHSNLDDSKATREDQLYVKSIIENEIYPHLRPEYQFPIYLEDPDNPETIPNGQYGKIVIKPSKDGFGIGVSDNNQDGIADESIIYLAEGYWNETGKSGILQETFSSLTSMNEVAPWGTNPDIEYGHWEGDKWRTYSALATVGGGATINLGLTQSDDKLINIEHRYKPLESIENVLGL